MQFKLSGENACSMAAGACMCMSVCLHTQVSPYSLQATSSNFGTVRDMSPTLPSSHSRLHWLQPKTRVACLNMNSTVHNHAHDVLTGKRIKLPRET